MFTTIAYSCKIECEPWSYFFAMKQSWTWAMRYKPCLASFSLQSQEQALPWQDCTWAPFNLNFKSVLKQSNGHRDMLFCHRTWCALAHLPCHSHSLEPVLWEPAKSTKFGDDGVARSVLIAKHTTGDTNDDCAILLGTLSVYLHIQPMTSL